MDNVYELARVLRVPGTHNVKDPDNPKPVTLNLPDGGRTLTLDEVEKALDAAGVPADATLKDARKVQDGAAAGLAPDDGPGRRDDKSEVVVADVTPEERLKSWCDRVANCPESAGQYGGRNNTLNNAALNLGHYVPKYLDEHQVRDALLDAARTAGMDHSDARSTINSGLRAGMASPRELSTTAQTQQQTVALAHRMVDHVRGTHRTFVGDDGRSYMVRRDGGRLAEPITSSAVIRACWKLAGTASLASPAKDAATVLSALAADAEPVTLSLRVARHGDGLVLDLGQRGNTMCVHVTADGWTSLDQPPEGVLFRRSKVTQPLPVPVRGGSLDRLRDILDLTEEQWNVVKGWLAVSLLPNVPRPMLAFLGVQGSAKTTRAAMVCGVYDPKPEHSLGSSFAKSLSDDRVKALSHFLVTYDNLTNVSRDASDHLARLVTGDSADARQLYTDGDLFTVTYKRTGLFTAITLPPLQPDARERVVPIALERIPEHKRRPEEELWREFDAAWPQTLGAVLDLAVTMLANLPSVRASTTAFPRMADYYVALKAIGADLADAYWAAVNDSMREAAEDDPFVATVVKWLDAEWASRCKQGKDVLAFTPTAAWDGAGVHRDRDAADHFGKGVSWWPNSAKTFSDAITRASEPLRALGIVVKRGRSHGERKIRFSRGPQWGSQGDAAGDLGDARAESATPSFSWPGHRNSCRGTQGTQNAGTLLTRTPEEKRGAGATSMA